MENELGWYVDFESALDAARSHGKPVLLQFHREECAGCKKMYTGTFTEADVQRDLFQWFIPVRLDIMKTREVRVKYSAYWTPSFFFLDYHGKLFEKFNGYLNAEDFRIILRLGLAAIDIPRGRYFDVIERMDEGLKLFPNNPRSASMLFTRGMAEYLIGTEKSSFRGAMKEITELYPNSPEARMWPWMDKSA
jgi:thioredoxin-related protein